MIFGFAGLIDAIARRIERELGGEPTIIATGGLANAIAPYCETIDEIDDLLTLTGLRLIWELQPNERSGHDRERPPLTARSRSPDVEVANRVLLAPLAGIGNWFVRLQARRYGAGLAVSEMVSSFALAHRNRRTIEEMLRVHPDEGPLSLQLFGADPEVMREAAAVAAEGAARPDRPQHGLPGPEGVQDRRRRGADPRPGRRGRGRPCRRRGLRPAGDRQAALRHRARRPLAASSWRVRLAEEAGVAAIALHPRSAKVHHAGEADYDLVAELRGARRSSVPVIVSGGARTAEAARRAYESSGADAVMIARGSLGNPWLFAELVGARRAAAGRRRGDRRAALGDRARQSSTGASGAPARNLRKFYPWYLERLGYRGAEADAFQRTGDLAQVSAMLDALPGPAVRA